MTRTFTHSTARRKRVPVLMAVVGPSGSGKTFSALRLATGLVRVTGGRVFGIDTEADRMTHYARSRSNPEGFDFEHVSFAPPFGPLDYLAAIEHCVRAGAGCVVIDSMTHEHSGTGGVLDQSEQYLLKKLGDRSEDFKARSQYLSSSFIKPKRERKALNNAIIQLGVNAIFCYRAEDKIKPVKGDEPLHLGWQADTTSRIYYDFLARLLLTPGCDGRPTLIPETDAEKRLVKNPEIARQLFQQGMQLDEALGEKLGRWGMGDEATPLVNFDTLSKRITDAENDEQLEALGNAMKEAIDRRLITPAETKELRALFGKIREAFRNV